jgi:aminoglycoside 3-N-acetyltransferase
MPDAVGQIQTDQARRRVADGLRALGVTAGQVLLVHASLRSLGPVPGGAATIVAAIRDVIGSEGTLVVPAGTSSNSDTSRLYLARTAGMTDEEVRRYWAAMPPFDPVSTPSEGMGRVAEYVRTLPGAIRSAHPQSSFAAVGPMAHELMDNHATDCHLGESSPLARLYDTQATILLMGVDYRACTAFHLAEYRYAPSPPVRSYRCVIAMAGEPVWYEYSDVVLDDQYLGELGADFDRAGMAVTGYVMEAYCRLASLVTAVDFATEWLRHRRTADLESRPPFIPQAGPRIERPRLGRVDPVDPGEDDG